MRRPDLYDAVAQKLGIVVQVPKWRRLVRIVAVRAGALAVKSFGHLRFRCIKRKGADWSPAHALSRRQVGELRRKWEVRAASEDASPGRHRGAEWFLSRQQLSESFFREATDWYWRQRRDLEVWGLYVLEGLPISSIAQRLELGHDYVHRAIKRYRAAMEAEHPHPKARALGKRWSWDVNRTPGAIQETGDGKNDGGQGGPCDQDEAPPEEDGP